MSWLPPSNKELIDMQAAGTLPAPATPKAPKGQSSYAGYRSSLTPSKTALRKDPPNVANTDLLTARNLQPASVIRTLASTSPDLSAAVSSNIRLGVPEKYKMKARTLDGQFDADGTRLAYEIIRRIDLLGDYTMGFSQTGSLRSVSESLAKELQLEGAACMELVLDKARVPTRFQPIPVSSLEFTEDGDALTIAQKVGGKAVPLDYPTVMYVSLDQDLLKAYPESPLTAAVQPVLADYQLQNDLRRVANRAVHPRLVATIDAEKVVASAPPEIQNDPEKLAAFMTASRDAVESTVNGLSPEDALTTFDSVVFSYLNNPAAVGDNFSSLQEMINSKLSTGAKTMPAMLGHGAGSQNIASSETLLALLYANSIIRLKLNELYSKALTLAVRLYGLDVVVEFTYDAIDLRPELELEAFRAMKQSRILEQLSLGQLSDEEACIDLTGNLPPVGAQKLSGTMFKTTSSTVANPYSGTSTGDGGGAMNQSLKNTTPTQKKS